jgi:hypothetical protein
MPIAPQATDFDTGTQIFQALFDTVTTGTKAYTEFNKLALSELGYIFLIKDATYGETLRFESATYRNGSRTVKQVTVPSCDSGFLLNEDGSYLLNEDGSRFLLDMGATDVIISDTMLNMSVVYGKNVINRATARAHPKKTDTSAVVLFSLDTPIAIAAGETITFKGKYSDPVGGLTVNAISDTMGTIHIDPSDEVSILHMDGADGGTVFTDASGKTWTPTGVTTTTSSRKFGTGSCDFGTLGWYNYLTTTGHPDFEPGAGDFTLDFWMKFIAVNGDIVFFTRNPYNDSTNSFRFLYSYPANTFNFRVRANSATKAEYTMSWVPTVGSWTHYAFVRYGTSFMMFVNGTKQVLTVNTAISTNDLTFSTPETYVWIGTDGLSDAYGSFRCPKGYMDEFHWEKGVAKWTADFTPPTEEYVTSDYLMYITATGEDITDELTVSVVYGTEAPIYTLTNTSIYDATISVLRARGMGVYAYNPIEGTVEDSTSILAYGENAETVDQLYQRDLTAGQAWATAIVAAEKDPRLVLESVTMNANTSGTLMQAFLNCDVGDLIHVDETRTGINGDFYIQNVSYDIQPGGIINFTWGLKEQL